MEIQSLIQVVRRKNRKRWFARFLCKWKRNLLTNKFYTKLISQSPKNYFEFYRNKEFFENVLAGKILN